MGVSDEHSSIEGVLLEATQAVLRQKDAERLRELRLSALLTLQEQLMTHRRNGIREDILCRLAGKKADRILNIRTKEEAERLRIRRSRTLTEIGMLPQRIPFRRKSFCSGVSSPKRFR